MYFMYLVIFVNSTKTCNVGSHSKCLAKVLLMGTYNIHFYGEISKIC